MTPVRKLLLIGFGILISFGAEAKKVDLKYQLKAGMTISYESVITQEIAQEVMGQAQNTDSETKQTITFKVIEVGEDGNYRISREIAKLAIKMSSAMGDIEFSSDDVPEEEGPWNLIKWMQEEPIIFTMTPKGNIISIEKKDEIVDRFSEMIENAGIEAQIFLNLMAQYSSEEGLKQILASFFMTFPKEKIKVGKSWEEVSEVSQMINFINSVSTTLAEADAEKVVLSQQVKIEMGEMPEAPMEMEGMEMNYEMDGGREASITLASDTGVVIKAEGITSIAGVISVDSPQLPSPMTIPMSIKSTESTILIK